MSKPFEKDFRQSFRRIELRGVTEVIGEETIDIFGEVCVEIIAHFSRKNTVEAAPDQAGRCL